MGPAVEVRKSPSDDREYRYVELSNGLRALLIHDADADKAAASMNVNIGSSHDPPEFPGLAHFCEHMLFLGTKRFPVENEYSSFLSQHGGHCNAFTSSHDTNYYFNVAQPHLVGALDRFCEFFKEPLFNRDMTEREVNAVDSENDKNLKADNWRLHHLMKVNSDPAHPHNKFSTGNKKTLMDDPEAKGLDTRAALLDFHSRYYSANLMTLCVLGRETLDDLERVVRERFEGVANKGVTSPLHGGHPLRGEHLGRCVHAVPVRECHDVTLTFAVPDDTLAWATQPAHYVSHLVGHESEGSLLSHLKANGWADALSAGLSTGEVGTYGFFKVTVHLSKEGLDHVDDVVAAVFVYVAMLRSADPPEWIFDECRRLNVIYWRFMDKWPPEAACTRLSKNLQLYPPAQVISAPTDLERFDAAAIKSLLELLRPDNMVLTVVAKENEALDGLQEEPVYGTVYKAQPFTAEQLERWRGAARPEAAKDHPHMHLPKPNEFIATDFELQPLPAALDDDAPPTMLVDTPRLRTWHRQDGRFRLPKASISVVLTSAEAYTSPRAAVLARLFVDLFHDSLTEYAYDAELAGIGYTVNHTTYGVDIGVSGYHDRLEQFMMVVLERLVSFEVDASRFPFIKDQYRRRLANVRTAVPTVRAQKAMLKLLWQRYYDSEALLVAIEGMTRDDVQAQIPRLLERVHLECFVYGNFTAGQAADIATHIEQRFSGAHGSGSLLPCERQRWRSYGLEEADCEYTETTDVHDICCVMHHVQTNLEDVPTNAVLNLFAQIVAEECFEQLRTREQLGYSVGSGMAAVNGVRSFRVMVQSNIDADHVAGRIRAFLAGVGAYVADMPPERFDKFVQALSNRLTEKPKTMRAQFYVWWTEIASGSYVFDRKARTNEIVLGLTKSDVLRFYRTHVDPASPRRRELVVRVVPSKAGALKPAPAETPSPAHGDGSDGRDGGGGAGGVKASGSVSKATVLQVAGAVAGGVAGAWAGGNRAGTPVGGGAVLGALLGAVAGRALAAPLLQGGDADDDDADGGDGSGADALPPRPHEPVVISDIADWQRRLALMPLPSPELHPLAAVPQ